MGIELYLVLGVLWIATMYLAVRGIADIADAVDNLAGVIQGVFAEDDDEGDDMLQEVFRDGKLLIDENFAAIRERRLIWSGIWERVLA